MIGPADIRSLVLGSLVAVVFIGIVWGVVGFVHVGEEPSADIIGAEQFGSEPRNTTFVVAETANGTTAVQRGNVHVTSSGLPARTTYALIENGTTEREFDGYQRRFQKGTFSTEDGYSGLFIRASFNRTAPYEEIVNGTNRARLRLNNTSNTAYYSSTTLRKEGPPFFGVDSRIVGDALASPSYEKVRDVNDTHVVYEPDGSWVRNVSGQQDTWRVHETDGRVVYDLPDRHIERADVSYTLTQDATWAAVWFEADDPRDRQSVTVQYKRKHPDSSLSPPEWTVDP